ncbi:MAG: NAD(P)H-dependent oxidoreductase [Patescibacteria group bacterium]|jgi:NAD(P)H dehydrogenase (quinone)|nr:NAD(P)H-dependent oxidoreductase [Patescibacteria group bacterium]
MTILSVYAHHEPSSLTSALKNITISTLLHQGHTVLETDLYGSGFSPKAEKYDFTTTSGQHFNYMLEQKHAQLAGMGFAPDIIAELEKLAQAEIVVFHTPLWWFSVPAVLKGWFDRVLAMGVAWDGGKIYENGLLRGKKAMLCVVAGGPEEYYKPNGKHKATIEQILHPIQHGTLAFCGFDVIEPFVILNSLGQSQESLQSKIADYQFKIDHLVDSPAYFSTFS